MRIGFVALSGLLAGCADEVHWAFGVAETGAFEWPQGESVLFVDAQIVQQPGPFPDTPISNTLRVSTTPPVQIRFLDQPGERPRDMPGSANLSDVLVPCEDRPCRQTVSLELSTQADLLRVEVTGDILLTSDRWATGEDIARVDVRYVPARE